MKFEEPVLEYVKFEALDVIVTSNIASGGNMPWGEDELPESYSEPESF